MLFFGRANRRRSNSGVATRRGVDNGRAEFRRRYATGNSQRQKAKRLALKH